MHRMRASVAVLSALLISGCGKDDPSKSFRVTSISTIAYGEFAHPRQTCTISYADDQATGALCDIDEGPRNGYSASYSGELISGATQFFGAVRWPIAFGYDSVGALTTVAYDWGDGDASVYNLQYSNSLLQRSQHRLAWFGTTDINTSNFSYTGQLISRIDSDTFGANFTETFLYAGEVPTGVLFSGQAGSSSLNLEFDGTGSISRFTSATSSTNIFYDDESGSISEVERLDNTGATVEKTFITYEKAVSSLGWAPPIPYGMFFELNGSFRGHPETNSIDWLFGPDVFGALF